MPKRGVCKDLVANCVSDGRLRKAGQVWSHRAGREEEEKAEKALSEGRELGKTTAHAASPRLPASAPSRARSLSSPFPCAPFSGDTSLHPSLLSLPSQTPLQIRAATCKLFFNYYFPFRFFSFFLLFFLFLERIPLKSANNSLLLWRRLHPAGPSPIGEAMLRAF